MIPRYFPIWQSKEMSHEFVRGQSVAETCFSHWGYIILTSGMYVKPKVSEGSLLYSGIIIRYFVCIYMETKGSGMLFTA